MRYVMPLMLIALVTTILAPASTAAEPAPCAGSSAAPPDAPMALVLSGGGAKGAWEAGVAAALVEAGLPIALVAGSSAGALNGAMIAAGRVERLEALWRGLDPDKLYSLRAPVFFAGLLAGLAHPGGARSGGLALRRPPAARPHRDDGGDRPHPRRADAPARHHDRPRAARQADLRQCHRDGRRALRGGGGARRLSPRRDRRRAPGGRRAHRPRARAGGARGGGSPRPRAGGDELCAGGARAAADDHARGHRGSVRDEHDPPDPPRRRAGAAQVSDRRRAAPHPFGAAAAAPARLRRQWDDPRAGPRARGRRRVRHALRR